MEGFANEQKAKVHEVYLQDKKNIQCLVTKQILYVESSRPPKLVGPFGASLG